MRSADGQNRGDRPVLFFARAIPEPGPSLLRAVFALAGCVGGDAGGSAADADADADAVGVGVVAAPLSHEAIVAGVPGATVLLPTIVDRVDAEIIEAAGTVAPGHLELRGRLQQHRRRRGDRARRAGDQHPRGPDRRHRRSHVDVAPGGGPERGARADVSSTADRTGSGIRSCCAAATWPVGRWASWAWGASAAPLPVGPRVSACGSIYTRRSGPLARRPAESPPGIDPTSGSIAPNWTTCCARPTW